MAIHLRKKVRHEAISILTVIAKNAKNYLILK